MIYLRSSCLALVSGALAFFSCSTATEVVQEPPGYTLQVAGTKTWKTSANDIGATSYLAFYQQGEEAYLVWENKFDKALEFYAWKADSLSHRILPDEQLLKSRCSMRGAYIASLDSVYIMDPMDTKNYKLHLFNRSGKLVSTLQSKDGALVGLEKAMPEINANKPALRRGNWLYLIGVPEGDFREAHTYEKGKIEVAINLRTGEYRYGYHYPGRYTEEGSWSNFSDVSRCLTPGNKFLYSFGIEDSVRLTDTQQEETLFYAGSDYFADTALHQNGAGKPEENQHPPFYAGILYDSENEVYYRMAVHALPENAESAWVANRPASVIILNKELEKAGEYLLPVGKHLYYQWFIGPDGLYIANHYEHRKQANIGELSFTRYQLVAKKD